MRVANKTPKARLMAMGMRKRAWRLFSKIMGHRPKKVVRVVMMIGRKRRVAELQTISITGSPEDLRRLIKSINIRESLTTTPVRATIPNMESRERLKPIMT